MTAGLFTVRVRILIKILLSRLVAGYSYVNRKGLFGLYRRFARPNVRTLSILQAVYHSLCC